MALEDVDLKLGHYDSDGIEVVDVEGQIDPARSRQLWLARGDCGDRGGRGQQRCGDLVDDRRETAQLDG
jgi:hypothetical protein